VNARPTRAAPFLVTGANGVLASALAARLARDGPVALHARTGERRLRALGLEDAVVVRGDLAAAAGRDALVKAAAAHAPLAGIALAASAFERTEPTPAGAAAVAAVVHRELAVPLELALRLAPLVADGGRVLLFSDTGTALGWGRHAAYLAAKAGLEAATRSLARALGPRLAVCCVAPGAIAGSPPPPERTVLDAVPLGRLARPEEVAEAVVRFLALPATVVTGQLLVVDGGRRLAPF